MTSLISLGAYTADLTALRASTWALLEDVTETVTTHGLYNDATATQLAQALATLLLAADAVGQALAANRGQS